MADVSAIQIILVGIILIFGYLWLSHAINSQLFFVFSGAMIYALWVTKNETRKINLKTAERKAREKIEEMQKEGRIDSGEIEVMPEEGLKYMAIGSENPGEFDILRHRFDIAVLVHGRITKAYLVKVHEAGGDIIGISRIRRPRKFSMGKSPDIIRVEIEKGKKLPTGDKGVQGISEVESTEAEEQQ